MDVTQVLLAGQSADLQTRQQAEQQIEAAQASNLPLLCSLLATELANETKELHVRQLAGVVLKNCLVAKDSSLSASKAAMWLAIGAAERTQIKASVLGALGSPQQSARHTAALVVSAIGVIELPHNQWPELIAGLVNNVTSTGNDFLKQSSLEAIGYVCEEIEPATLEPQSNLILTAVVQGMRKEEANFDVRLAATRALLNALEFVRTNFEKEHERNYIMQTVCETTQAEHKELKVAAYECIVHIAELYYDQLPQYMPALYQLTLAAIQKAVSAPLDEDEEDDVGQQAVEFWTTICDEEIDLAEEAEEARIANRSPDRPCHNFVRQGLAHLCPQLLQAMCKQEEDADDDTWNMALASSTCLAKIGQSVGDDVLPNVMPFVEGHITSQDWRHREASCLAFGSVLEGPSDLALAPYMSQAIDVMVRLMHDPSVQVRDTAAWTIGRICEHHTSSIQPPHWAAMMGSGPTEGVLLTGLKDVPRVASNICWALHNLAEQLEDTRTAATNPLSPLFITLARALLACTERPDAREHNLRCSAYEALNTTLTNSAEDTRPNIEQLLPVVLERLKATFAVQIVSNDDREAQTELQGLLCGTLQVITQKLGPAAIPHADAMMQLFLEVFGAKSSTVQEEALMAVGAVANATEAGFERYMSRFRPFLSLGLANYKEHQVCSVAIGVVGDICRALEAKMLPYCNEIVDTLLKHLQNPEVNRTVKPPILSCFGDIALAVGGGFETYMQATMSMLNQAAQTSVDLENPDLVEYLNQLREGIFEAYTGILQGLRADDKSAAFENAAYVMGALALIKQVAEGIPQGIVTDDVLRAAVGVVGDLGSSLGLNFKQLARQPPHRECIKALLKEARASSSENTKQVANWANHAAFSA